MNLSALSQAIEAKTKANPEPVPNSIAALTAALNAVSNPPAQSNPTQIYNMGSGQNGAMAQLCADLRTERNNQGLTQRQLAAKANMSQGTITRAERHGWISIWALLKITSALGKQIKLT